MTNEKYNDIGELEAAWRNTEPKEESEGGNFDRVPDGKYQAKIIEVVLNRTKEKNLPMLTFHLELIDEAESLSDDSYGGRHLWMNRVLQSEENIQFAKRDLAHCGIELKLLMAGSSLEDLLIALPSLSGNIVDLTLKTKGQYQNTYINKVVRKNENKHEELPSATTRASKEEPAPFKKKKADNLPF